jgi:hypothetical protein
VNPSYIRANLEATGAVEVSGPSGQVSTLYIMRRGDPHDPMIRSSNLYLTACTLNRIRRALRRDVHWHVEIVAGSKGDDLRSAEVVGTFPSKALALAHAETAACALSAGQRPPEQLLSDHAETER